ncbi:hypothetical protein POM88_000930 [Heracleum sosnowskyi]|uniref:Replication protein A 70 kDa DNA-binding subunit B/D first OB fold domain-containing protein n=1 Tax=Heracleum sosnowskyi TaxID=360622 RepID=A0AAD8N4H0_9APIA|nr:hypothetical protein POM88_000930 [Heracleum sosnowskyi]
MFEKDLNEGDIYIISNFHVRDYIGDEFNRCVRTENHIYFADFTKVEKDSNVGLRIQDCSFDLFDLLDTEKMEEDKRFLCDVIGVIDDKPTLREYVTESNEEKTQLKFSITDGRCSRKVSFFGHLAKEVDDALKDSCENPVIIIIASVKCNTDLIIIYGRFKCQECGRIYPHPDKRFCTLCCDSTRGIAIVFNDREMRKLTGKTVFEVTLDEAQEMLEDNTTPSEATPTTGQSSTKSRARKSPQSSKEVDDENVPLKMLKFVKKEKVSHFAFMFTLPIPIQIASSVTITTFLKSVNKLPHFPYYIDITFLHTFTMSIQIFNNIKDVSPGSFNWNLKVRIVRFWRGVSRTGEEFKGFNILILDDKHDRMHAFIPGNLAEKFEEQIKVGKVYIIFNFIVKDYKAEDRFRCIDSNRQIILKNFTQIEEIHANDSLIPHNVFDFYDLNDLKVIANKNIYLPDIVGVMEKELPPLRRFKNCNGEPQCQLKFQITDGSTNVTFWDNLAEELEEEFNKNMEYPRIIIIASAKITSWKDTIEISNVTATKFYLNYNHHSVIELRKMLNTPLFSKYDFSSQKTEKLENLSVHEIHCLDETYIQASTIT